MRLADAVRWFPEAAGWSLVIALPFGAFAGIVGAVIVTALSRGRLRGAPRGRWIAAGARAGAVVGLLAVPVMALGGLALWAVVCMPFFAGAGALAGSLVALLGWVGLREERAPRTKTRGTDVVEPRGHTII
jgi:protein-S-isoprenylcysteine O-methyltransferase Ste14